MASTIFSSRGKIEPKVCLVFSLFMAIQLRFESITPPNYPVFHGLHIPQSFSLVFLFQPIPNFEFIKLAVFAHLVMGNFIGSRPGVQPGYRDVQLLCHFNDANKILIH